MQEVILKKVMFGGYDCFDVMNHINALQIKLNRAKEKKIDVTELYDEAERLRAELYKKDEEIDALTHLIYTREHENVKRRSAGFSVENTDSSDSERVDDTREKIEILQQQIAQISGMINEMSKSLSVLNSEYKQSDEMKKITQPEQKEKMEPTAKKSRKKKTTAKPKANAEALELLRQSEERYKNL